MRLVRFWRFISFSSYFNSGILKLSHMRLLLLVAKFVRVRLQLTLGARGFLREEPQSAISEARSDEEREKTSGCARQLTDLTAPIDLN